MSIATAIENAQQKVENAYTAISNKGGTLPATQDLSNMPTAINSIPTTSPVIQSLNVTPSTSAQTITATGGVDGYSPIEVSAVTSAIDANIVAGNIKQGATILGVSGSVVELNGTTTSITPTTSSQTVTPTSPNNAFTSVTVPAVTSSIDANITAGNIKDGVTILGVTGNYTGGGSFFGIPREVDYDSDSGEEIFGKPQTSFTFSTGLAQSFGYTYGLYRAFSAGQSENYTALTSVDMSHIEKIRDNQLYCAFKWNRGITSVDLSSLIFISSNNAATTAAEDAFYGCTSLATLDISNLEFITGQNVCKNMFCGSAISTLNLSSLETISGQTAAEGMFLDSTNLTSVDISSLTDISGNRACRNMFQNTGITSITFTSLSDLSAANATQCFYEMFAFTPITSISFPALTSSSFGSNTNQFNNMLSTYDGGSCTVHFPSNLQSVIGSWSDVTNGFGGSNVTVLFDLPATS